MNEFSVSVTPEGVTQYPIHQHNNWEIMYYLEGEGYMATPNINLPFKKGTIIIIPPSTPHGSVSKNGFVNISVNGKFNNLLLYNKPISFSDNNNYEGETLARLILNNRYCNNDYLESLCNTYTAFLLQNQKFENQINQAIHKIVEYTSKHFNEFDFNISDLIKNSGYAEDYLRTRFKKATGFSPVQFLLNMRIEHAKKLLEIYSNSLSVSEIGEACGFDDLAYFSRCFKKFTKKSPNSYKTDTVSS